MTFVTCAYCGNKSEKIAGHVNRARKLGNALYCNRECAGLARRTHKSEAQKKADKREYDREYRAKNYEKMKPKKAAYHKATYDPVKEAVKRKKRMPQHVEYCRRPEYRAWKKQYDRKYRARKNYGPFAEHFLLTMEIRDECLAQQTDYEIRLSKGTLNKCIKRRRNYFI